MKNAAVDGAGAGLGGVEAGAEPFEIGSVAAIDLDGEESGRRDMQSVLGLVLDGLGEFFRGNLAQSEVHAGEVLAIQRVELGVIGGTVFGAEPPAPVATFRGEQRLISLLQAGFRGGIATLLHARLGSSRIGLARVPEQFPSGNIFGVTNPDVEIGVDPRGGEESPSGRVFPWGPRVVCWR